MRTLASLNFPGRVLLRADFNVPLEDGRITDDARIRAALPTIKYLREKGVKLAILSHLGRPNGQEDSRYSLAPVARRLSEYLGTEVPLLDLADSPEQAAEVVVLENVRFYPEETSKDPAQRRLLAERFSLWGEAMVSDGFGVAHRKQASVYELAELLPSAAGLLIETEIQAAARLSDPQRPYTVVLGGAKVSDKLAVIENLLTKVDCMLIGGGMMFTFLAALGYDTAASLLEKELIPQAARFIELAKQHGVELVLPQDVVVADSLDAPAGLVTAADAIAEPLGSKAMGLDIGPKTQQRFREAIAASRTVFWNGPMGVFEKAPFAAGTRAVIEAMRDNPGFSFVGGGDSAAAVALLGYDTASFGHVSTGGGACLELLEGKLLPGLEVLGYEQ